MELIVVGCSGSVSGPHSPASSYLVQAPFDGRTFSLLLDLGPGAFGALYRYLPDPSSVDVIAFSHLHPDHCLDFCAFNVAASHSPTAPWARRQVYGPAGTAARLARAEEVPTPTSGQRKPGLETSPLFDWQTWRPSQQIGPFDVSTARVEHPVPAYAIRVEERSSGASLVYSGDTGPCHALVELASHADLLLVESAHLDRPDNPTGLHLSGSQAAQAGAEAGVGAVLLTHIPPWHDPAAVLAEAKPHFAGPLTLATPGLRQAIG